MYKYAIQLAVLTLVIATSHVLAKPYELPITNLQNRPAVLVSINNSEPVLLIIDTGFGGELLIDNSVAERLGLKHLRTRTMNNLGMGDITLEDYEGATLKIGELSINIETVEGHKGHARMLAQMGADKNGNKPVGTISPWILTKGTITFQSDGQSINIDNSQHLSRKEPGVVEYNFSAGIPTFTTKISGKNYVSHLDTGSPAQLVLPSKYLKEFQYLEEPQARGGAQTVGRMHKLWTAKLKGSVTFGDINLENPDVLFIEAFPAVNVGLRALKNGSVTIDPKNELIQFKI